jgi:nucleoside-triphosphatase
MTGFYTEEIKVGNVRQGFDLVTLQGERFTLAHTRIRSGYRVGKYGISVDIIDKAVAATLNAEDTPELYVIDEIGKMECFSTLFVRRMTQLLDCGTPVVASIALRGGGFIAKVKNRPGTTLWEITKENRDAMPGKVAAWLSARVTG